MNLDELAITIGVAARGRLTSPMGYQWRRDSARLLRRTFHDLCHDLGVSNLLEIGAHRAEVSIEFMKSGKGRTRAFAYEANPYTFERKTSMASRHGVQVRQLGLGKNATEDKIEFLIPLWRESVDPLTPGNASFMTRVESTDYERVLVGMTSVDQECLENGIVGCSALWIDVEGYAFEVLEGAANLLASGDCSMICVELESVAFWHNQRTSVKVDAALQAFGYTAVMRDAEFNTQFNVVYVHRDRLADVDEQVMAYWGALAQMRVSYLNHAVTLVRQKLRVRSRMRNVRYKWAVSR